MKENDNINAEVAIRNDPFVRDLMEMFGATIVEDSIQPYVEPVLKNSTLDSIGIKTSLSHADSEINAPLDSREFEMPLPVNVYEKEFDMPLSENVYEQELSHFNESEEAFIVPLAIPKEVVRVVAIPEVVITEVVNPVRKFKF